MAQIKKNGAFAARLKFPLMCIVFFVLISISSHAFSQTTPPGGPPPPPPPPGELFKKINPFKKHKDTLNKKDTSKNKQSKANRPPGGPPPPPNPLDLFKKKKDTTKKAPAPTTGN